MTGSDRKSAEHRHPPSCQTPFKYRVNWYQLRVPTHVSYSIHGAHRRRLYPPGVDSPNREARYQNHTCNHVWVLSMSRTRSKPLSFRPQYSPIASLRILTARLREMIHHCQVLEHALEHLSALPPPLLLHYAVSTHVVSHSSALGTSVCDLFVPFSIVLTLNPRIAFMSILHRHDSTSASLSAPNQGHFLFATRVCSVLCLNHNCGAPSRLATADGIHDFRMRDVSSNARCLSPKLLVIWLTLHLVCSACKSDSVSDVLICLP